MNCSLLGGDEVPARGLALGRVADHRDFLRDVEGQQIVLAGAPAGFPQKRGKVLPLLKGVVGEDAAHPIVEAGRDTQPPVQRPCIDLLVVRQGQEGGG